MTLLGGNFSGRVSRILTWPLIPTCRRIPVCGVLYRLPEEGPGAVVSTMWIPLWSASERPPEPDPSSAADR